MLNPAYDIFKRDGFGSRAWVEGARDVEAANRRILELSANSPGKYLIVSRASGQMVGGGTTITSSSSEPTAERPARESKPQAAKGANSSRTSSSHEVPSHAETEAESETLWR
jgi:hypothetical protein